jgi:hypothetical protein
VGFVSVGDYVAAREAGRVVASSFRKVPSQASVAQWWVDLSMAAGNPPPNYYASAPLVAASLDGMRGLYHGDAVGPAEKFLAELVLASPSAGLVGRYLLADYLLYYPFVDLDDGDAQSFDNTVTLGRYTDGDGVMAILVAAAPTVGGGSFQFDYINQDGDAATSPVQSCSAAPANIASIVTSEPGTAAGGLPFLRLASGDTGIRRITSWTNLVLNGGLGAIALVKPLADITVREVGTAVETSLVNAMAGCPRIHDGAYLNLLVQCAASVAAGQLAGRAVFAWTEG